VPHIHLETTADLIENGDIPELLGSLTAAMAAVESVPSASLKAYHTLHTNWTVGEGHAAGFAHCTLAIMEGRSPEQQETIADVVFAELSRGFERSLASRDVVVTLEIRQIAKATYRRTTVSTLPANGD
jgi:5-carboxymethyl-2-hydroxymuconate isomerase